MWTLVEAQICTKAVRFDWHLACSRDMKMNFADNTTRNSSEKNGKKPKKSQGNLLRSALIVGYILAVLLFAGLAQANWKKAGFKSQSLEEVLRVHRIA